MPTILLAAGVRRLFIQQQSDDVPVTRDSGVVGASALTKPASPLRGLPPYALITSWFLPLAFIVARQALQSIFYLLI